MRRLLPHPLPDTPDALLQKAGYVRHCVEAGRVCYHRRVNDVPFPRFHVWVSLSERGMEIDLHIDALNIQHQGNHGEPWAYEGGRVESEMHRIVETIDGRAGLGKVNQPSSASLRMREDASPKRKKFLEKISGFI